MIARQPYVTLSAMSKYIIAPFVFALVIGPSCKEQCEERDCSDAETYEDFAQCVEENAACAGDEDGDCTPGTETCSCIEGGLCVEGLVCASGLCVDLGESSGPESTGAKPMDDGADGGDTAAGDTGGDTGDAGGDSGGDAEGDGGPAPSCDCADDEVCSASEGACVDPYFRRYDVYVTNWVDYTPGCWDAFADDCFADVLFVATYDGVEVYRSSHHTNVLVADWYDEPFELEINPFQGLTFSFYDWDDVTADDFTNSVCFVDGNGVCGPVPVETLHDGAATFESADFLVELAFVAQ